MRARVAPDRPVALRGLMSGLCSLTGQERRDRSPAGIAENQVSTNRAGAAGPFPCADMWGWFTAASFDLIALL